MAGLRRRSGIGLPWLTDPYRRFGERLGTVLFRVPDAAKRDDDRLGALLAAWPRDLPLTVEFRDPSWAAVVSLLRHAGAVLCATEGEDDDRPPMLRRTGLFLYLRLRRHDYTDIQLDAWRGSAGPVHRRRGRRVRLLPPRRDRSGRELALELLARFD